jgi:transcriptional regulator with XRE-family HTH domain
MSSRQRVPANNNISARQSSNIDVHVGRRLAERRAELGWTYRKLGDLCGLSGSQLAKYESGQNRLSASRLFQISVVLGVPVSWFFEDAPLAEEAQDVHSLVTSFNDIEDEPSRSQVVQLAKSLARLSHRNKG